MKIPSPKTNPSSILKKFQSIEQDSPLHAGCECNLCSLSSDFLLNGGPYNPSFLQRKKLEMTEVEYLWESPPPND